MLGGPMLLFDAVSTARRFRLALLRALYLCLLLAVLFAVYVGHFGRGVVWPVTHLFEPPSLPGQRIDRFTTSFTWAFLIGQYTVLMLLTPLFTVGAINDEHEKKTLGLLLLTQLSAADILIGKLLSRVAHLLLLLLAGLPLLSLLLMLGGTDPALLIAGFTCTFFSVCSAGSLSLMIAVIRFGQPGNLGMAYFGVGALSLVSIGLAPGVMLYRQSLQGMLGSQLPLVLFHSFLFHALVTACCLWRAILKLGASGAEEVRPSPTSLPILASAIQNQLVIPRLPPVTERPVLWMMTEVPRRFVRAYLPNEFKVLLLCGLLLLGLLSLIEVFVGAARIPVERAVVRFILTVFLVVGFTSLGAVMLAYRAAGTIAGERDRRTLETLLTTQLTNGELLAQKFLGCLEPLSAIMALLMLLAPAILRGVMSLPTTLLLELAVMGQMSFVTIVGMYYSLVCTTVFRAFTAALSVFGVVAIAHALLHLAISPPGIAPMWLFGSLASFEFLWSLPGSLDQEGRRMLLGLAAQMVYPLFAMLYWWRLHVRFGPGTGRLR